MRLLNDKRNLIMYIFSFANITVLHNIPFFSFASFKNYKNTKRSVPISHWVNHINIKECKKYWKLESAALLPAGGGGGGGGRGATLSRVNTVAGSYWDLLVTVSNTKGRSTVLTIAINKWKTGFHPLWVLISGIRIWIQQATQNRCYMQNNIWSASVRKNP